MSTPSRRLWSAHLVALAALFVAVLFPGSATAASSVTFSTPGSHTFTVPESVTAVRISATGAGGGDDPFSPTSECLPGKGGNVQATLSVTPGSQLAITVAGRGGDGTAATGGQGGVGGGGTGGTASFESGGGGGGASRVTLSGNPLLVGAGGGGCGAFNVSPGVLGDGGDDGSAGNNGTTATGGGPGTATAGGTGGQSANPADPSGGNGTSGQGGAGAGAPPQNGGGGGGGGGYFGGGGGGGVRSGQGTAGGGGGGSDFVAAGSSTVSTTPGSNAGDGQVTITYFTLTPPTVSGRTEVGQQLAATKGTATGGGNPSYQWLRGSDSSFTPIPGATGSSYNLVKADRGKRIKVTETVSDSGGSAAATSNQTRVVGPPIVSSSAKKTQRVLKQRGVFVRVTSNLAGTLNATGRVVLPSGAARTVRFKRARRNLAAGKSRRAKLRLSAKSLRSLRRGFSVKRRLNARVTLIVRDELGGKTTKRRTIRLRR